MDLVINATINSLLELSPMERADFISHILLALLGVMSAALLLALYRCIAVTCCSRRGSNSAVHRPPPRSLELAESGMASGSEISTVQLLPPARSYGKGVVVDCDDDITTCPVCLSDFKDGEAIRVLPRCNHYYHVACIDTWLRSHSSCPVCREQVTPLHQLMLQAAGGRLQN